MKAVFAISGVALLALAATAASGRDWDDDFKPQAPVVKQSGHYEWNWDGADGLALAVPATMHYTPGGAPRIVITGSDELLAHVQVGQGRIRLERGWDYTGSERLQVTVTGVTVHNIALSGSGKAELEKLDLDHLNLAISGSGSMTGEGRSDHLNVALSGSGHADLAHLRAHDANIHVSGNGSVTTSGGSEAVNLSMSGSSHVDLGQLQAHDANIHMSGNGTVMATGRSEHVSLSMTGSGTLDLARLETRDADIHITGSAKVDLTPRDTANVSVSGSGVVRMAAKPAHLNQTVHGSGGVRIAGD